MGGEWDDENAVTIEVSSKTSIINIDMMFPIQISEVFGRRLLNVNIAAEFSNDEKESFLNACSDVLSPSACANVQISTTNEIIISFHGDHVLLKEQVLLMSEEGLCLSQISLPPGSFLNGHSIEEAFAQNDDETTKTNGGRAIWAVLVFPVVLLITIIIFCFKYRWKNETEKLEF